eukprot:2684985-Alexandrium_andersonii.AAC.1
MTSAAEAFGPGKRPSSWNQSHPDMAGQPRGPRRRSGGRGDAYVLEDSHGRGRRSHGWPLQCRWHVAHAEGPALRLCSRTPAWAGNPSMSNAARQTSRKSTLAAEHCR